MRGHSQTKNELLAEVRRARDLIKSNQWAGAREALMRAGAGCEERMADFHPEAQGRPRCPQHGTLLTRDNWCVYGHHFVSKEE